MNTELELTFTLDQHMKMADPPSSAIKEKHLLEAARQKLGSRINERFRCTILKKSIDARNKRRVLIVYRIRIDDENEDARQESPRPLNAPPPMPRPVVVGMGPAGMFAAITLARNGMQPIIIERGRPIESRIRDVEAYFNGAPLVPFSNVQFGEGGAGTFSDGKLNSGISDIRRAFVLKTFVQAGAPEEILWASHPHIGTDRLRDVMLNIRSELLSLGATLLFERTVDEFLVNRGRIEGVYHASSTNGGDRTLLPCRSLVLAIGHSSRDTYAALRSAKISMTPKPFSVGLRIEHRQEWINRSQYGSFAGHPALAAAEYKLVSHTSTGRALYTFCMCPGGVVVPGANAHGQVVTNGMSNYSRSGANANSAILVGVDSPDFSENDLFAGMRFQESLEHAAFVAGGGEGKAPCQRLGDFLAGKASTSYGSVNPTFRPGVTCTDLRKILPEFVFETIRLGISGMERKIKGFSHPDSLLTGIETRSSAPLRIVRDSSLCSPDAAGLYPCGEGAGHAGGIMSSAIDGIKCAEMIVAEHRGEAR